MVTQLPKTSLQHETGRKRFSQFTESVFAAMLAVCIILFLQWMFGAAKSLTRANNSVVNNPSVSAASGDTNQIENNSDTSDAMASFADRIKELWPNADHDAITNKLLSGANSAVKNGDDESLADSMTLLGVNALQNKDIESASVYLNEALSVFEETGNEVGIANVELLRGELSLRKREDARRAGYTYDLLQVARWRVAQGQFDAAISELEFIVEENLSLNRFGAAAAAYETLYAGYQTNGQAVQAQNAGVELVKLHASSGRLLRAEGVLQELSIAGLDSDTQQLLHNEIISLQAEYEDSVTQMSRAKDYRQLYNYYMSAGDPVRAWQFRLKAQQSLSGVTRRAMHRRQSGVLALLYSSNKHMDNAEQSLSRAGDLFTSQGSKEKADLSINMQQRNY